MRRIYLLAVVAAAVLVGCGGGLKSKVVGTWRFDSSSLAMPGLTPEMKKMPQFTEQMKGLDAARIEFKADGTYMGTGMGTSGGGKWSLNDHTLVLVEDKPDKEKPTLTISDDGSKIHVSGPAPTGNGQMTMDMVKADAK